MLSVLVGTLFFSILGPPFHLSEETVEGRIPIPIDVLESKVDKRSIIWIEFDPENVDSGWALEVEALVIHPDGSTVELPLPYFGYIDREGYLNKTALRHHQLRDTYIDLRKFGIRERDLIRLHVRDLRKAEYDAIRYLSVIRTGLHVDVSSVILFSARRKKDGWHRIGPNTGVTYCFDFETRGRTFREKILNFVGLGLNFSLLDFDPGKDLEIGLAPVITLFGHVFQVGFGYDLSVENEPEFFILAFDLPEVLNLLHLVKK